jgi:hypothetical protein
MIVFNAQAGKSFLRAFCAELGVLNLMRSMNRATASPDAGLLPLSPQRQTYGRTTSRK